MDSAFVFNSFLSDPQFCSFLIIPWPTDVFTHVAIVNDKNKNKEIKRNDLLLENQLWETTVKDFYWWKWRQANPGFVIRDSSPLTLSLELCALLTVPTVKAFYECKLEIAVRYMGLNPVQVSKEKCKIMANRYGNLPILWLPRTSLVCKFPCSLKLPSTKWNGSSFDLCQPLTYKGLFQIHLGGFEFMNQHVGNDFKGPNKKSNHSH